MWCCHRLTRCVLRCTRIVKNELPCHLVKCRAPYPRYPTPFLDLLLFFSPRRNGQRFSAYRATKVHYLRETPKVDGADVAPRCVLHMNHGFGASSSSWTPVISSLSGALGALAVAHDTPGFGLTARTGIWRTNRYSLSNNAGEAARDTRWGALPGRGEGLA